MTATISPYCRICGDLHTEHDAPCQADLCVSKGCREPMSDPLLGLCAEHHRLVVAQRGRPTPERDLPGWARR